MLNLEALIRTADGNSPDGVAALHRLVDLRVYVTSPAEAERAPVAVVVDVLRATSTIAQALASGYRRVLCCAEIEEARALRAGMEEGVLAGERRAEAIPGFDLGNSPADFVEPRAETLVMTTTNGTRAVVAAAERCERVFIACGNWYVVSLNASSSRRC